jgi:hypothetical protein
VVQIDVLPDDVLLLIFDLCVFNGLYGGREVVEAWQLLVHVCRRWRRLVFQSPRRLNLRLYCTPKTPARDTLDIWLALPLIVWGITADMISSGTDNIIAALGQSNRVCKVTLSLTGLTDWQFEEVLAPMQVSFPELTMLSLWSHDETLPIPDSFLDGSAPRLRHFSCDIPFPGLPKLLFSATHLVYLGLSIPHSGYLSPGYLSPEAMVAPLSAMSSLERLTLKFECPQCRPDWETRRPPPSRRSVIPALTCFHFKGVIEYLEDLVTFIDAPQLNYFYITFFDPIDFDTPQLAQFVNRIPTLRSPDNAHVKFNDRTTNFELLAHSRTPELEIGISCQEPDSQLLSITQVCNSPSLPPPSTVGDLYIEHEYSQLVWKDDAIENALWLQLLHPFTMVKNLYLSKDFAPGIAAALQEFVGGRITELLPSLQNIFVEGLEPSGPFQENIGEFVTVRQLSGHPVAISVWSKPVSDEEEEEEEEEESTLSCMHSTLASIGHEADVVCT